MQAPGLSSLPDTKQHRCRRAHRQLRHLLKPLPPQTVFAAAGKQAQLRESVAVQPGSLLVFRDEAYTSSLHGIMEVGRPVPARLLVARGAAQMCWLLA